MKSRLNLMEVEVQQGMFRWDYAIYYSLYMEPVKPKEYFLTKRAALNSAQRWGSRFGLNIDTSMYEDEDMDNRKDTINEQEKEESS